MISATVIYGPKAVGKSRVARALRNHFGIHHVDPDRVVLDLQSEGVRPDPDADWLAHIPRRVLNRLHEGVAVCTEATGVYQSDWRLSSDLESDGYTVYRIWVEAPLEVALQRLLDRDEERVHVDPEGASRIYKAALVQAQHNTFDLAVDTSRSFPEEQILTRFRELLERQ